MDKYNDKKNKVAFKFNILVIKPILNDLKFEITILSELKSLLCSIFPGL